MFEPARDQATQTDPPSHSSPHNPLPAPVASPPQAEPSPADKPARPSHSSARRQPCHPDRFAPSRPPAENQNQLQTDSEIPPTSHPDHKPALNRNDTRCHGETKDIARGLASHRPPSDQNAS